MTDQKNLGCLCWKSGPITASLHTNRTGYVGGELVQFTAEVENLASREMDTTYLSLVEVVVFKAWAKERWEEREVERLTRQRPAVQRSESRHFERPSSVSLCEPLSSELISGLSGLLDD